LAALVAIAVLGVAAVTILAAGPEAPAADLPAMNDVAVRVADQFDALETGQAALPHRPGAPDYTVFDLSGRPVASTRTGLPDTLTGALGQGAAVMDLERDGRPLGKIAFADQRQEALAKKAAWWRLAGVAAVVGVAGACGAVLWRLNRRLLRPFREMEAFARRIAAGDLDLPLRMDRDHAFGAFTESFDLMRTELAAAGRREREAQVAKTELAASISHDIMTPVASIKAVAELALLEAHDPKVRQRLALIGAKADQIDTLTSDLLAASLEEAAELRIDAVPLASTELAAVLRQADSGSRVEQGPVPDCLFLADPVRLAQVVDNVVTNSRKYAGTPVEARASLEGGSLVLVLRDRGPGVAAEELGLLTSKYFRGAAAAGKPGAGLGLYISSRLMEQMGGSLELADAAPGLRTTLRFALA
jgi:signal transduction histidine kinase